MTRMARGLQRRDGGGCAECVRRACSAGVYRLGAAP